MFKSTILGQKYPPKQFKKIENELGVRLFNAQLACIKHQIPMLITIAGIDGAGRGKVMNMLAKWLDGKQVRSHTFWNPTDEDKNRPESWRYWMKIPAQGEFGIFLGGLYSEPIRKHACKEISEEKLVKLMRQGVEIENTLANSGMVILKFWLHLTKDEHEKRKEHRLKTKGEFHFTPYDKKSDDNYDGLASAASKAIAMTDRESAPWVVIDAFDDNFRNVAVVQALTDAIEKAVIKKQNTHAPAAPSLIDNIVHHACLFSDVDLSKTIEKQAYTAKLAKLQNDIFRLTYDAYQNRISTTLVFEGWDASGKGGAIRRLTEGIDARIARIIPISSPTDEELSHNYLWRFWRHVPMAGFITIYDRSWYGRVLVERVEGFAKNEEWKRAYSEINAFEEELVAEKNIIIKFWLHVSEDEQLKRFKEREKKSWKNYKITDDDWRNREQMQDYKAAANEMFLRTNTDYAPWHIISAESKLYARIEVLTIYRDALQKALKKHSEPIPKKKNTTKKIK